MQKFLLSATAIGAMLAVSSLATAQDDAGFYVRGNAGYGTYNDIDITGDVTGSVESEGNGTYSVGAGYDFGNNWRLEADSQYLSTDLGQVDSLPGSSAKLDTTTLMLNVLYDFDKFGGFEPYIGAGAGVVRGSGRAVVNDFLSGPAGAPGTSAVSSPACAGGIGCSFLDGDTGLGYQLLAGLGYQITDNLTWDTQYRYLNTNDLDFTGSVASSLTSIAEGATSFEGVGSHSILTGFRYKFGGAKKVAAAAPVAPVTLPAAPSAFRCWDGCMALSAADCAPQPQPQPEPVKTFQCWDGSTVTDLAQCPVQQETFSCWDGSLVYDRAQCPAVPAPVTNFNVCGPSPVAIFNVDGSKQAKSIGRLGTMPEFGDSHDLSPSQFYAKLQQRYSSNAGDRAYLNYLFKSMGYEGGFRDANEFMFTEETLPAGTRGLLGLGEQHHYGYYVLDTNERDREAFKIQSANGVVVHFMKTCGNYMYACE